MNREICHALGFENHISLSALEVLRENLINKAKKMSSSYFWHEARALERMIDVDFFDGLLHERSSRGAGHDEVCGVSRGDMFCAPVTEAHEIKSGKKFSPVPRIVGAIAMCISLTSPAWRYCIIVATPPPSNYRPYRSAKIPSALECCMNAFGDKLEAVPPFHHEIGAL